MIGSALRRVSTLPTWQRLLAVVLVAVLLGLGVRGVAMAAGQHGASSTSFPQSAAMEDRLGIRFSRVAVVGDGGLITVSYVVLDPEKASRFQSDVAHPPVLTSDSRKGSTSRVSLMKQGHSLRAGETYYLVYQNTKAALRHGEHATIVYADLQLKRVPVL
ncbi:MAG: hypothetical protein ABI140_21045 [Jatrophihabitantaceae bacterium]